MIKENIQAILDSLNTIKDKYGIDYDVQLMAVSKTKPVEAVVEAIEAGQVLFGENRVIEAYDKFKSPLLDGKNFSMHLIGHLQRNKAKKAVEIADMIQSIDKISTLDAVDRHCGALGKTVDYLIEVNTSFETQKQGISPETFDAFLEEIQTKNYQHCNLRGVMTVGPLTDDDAEIKKSFGMLKKLYDRIKDHLRKPDFDVLSMGMSGDYEIAVGEGSTLIRVGSSIFGTRNYF